MNRFAALLDRLAYEPGRNAKLRLLTDYFGSVPDPDRGYALAAITGALSFRYAKPGLIRTLIAERTDPALFALSYDYVGDLSETVALMWPVRDQKSGIRDQAAYGPISARVRLDDAADSSPPPCGEGLGVGVGRGGKAVPQGTTPHPNPPPQGGRESTRLSSASIAHGPALSEVVATLASLGKSDLPAQLAQWLDDLDEVGRWALLKLVTGAMRIGVSARLAKTAVAALGNRDADEIEIIWPKIGRAH